MPRKEDSPQKGKSLPTGSVHFACPHPFSLLRERDGRMEKNTESGAGKGELEFGL